MTFIKPMDVIIKRRVYGVPFRNHVNFVDYFSGTMSLFSCCGRKRSNHHYEEYIDIIDLNSSDLVDVPIHIFMYERTLEKLLLSSNHVST